MSHRFEGMRTMRMLVIPLLAIVAGEGAARADLGTGRDKLLSGDYPGAIAELKKVKGKDETVAKTFLAKAQIMTGDYAGAEATLAPVAKGATDEAADARLLLAEVKRMTGRAQEAKADLEALLKDRPSDRAVRTEVGAIRHMLGDKVGAKQMFDPAIKEFDRSDDKALPKCTRTATGTCKVDLDDPEQLVWLAISARLTSQFQLANDSFQWAIDKKPQLFDAAIMWADLFLQKYSAPNAEATLEEIFKINKNHPEAHAAMAEVITETSYDLQAVRHHLDAALAQNPKNARALKVRASVEIDGNRWDEANKLLDSVLAVNKEDVEAYAMRATIKWLRDDLAGYEAEKKKAFAINPGYAELYRIVARSAVREHRYVEAIDLEKEAVKLKPDYYEAMSGIGMGYLRLGMEKEGIDWVDKSWSGDQYNVRALNTRNLFKKTIPKEYSVAMTKNFRIRYHNDEKAVLSRYLEPTMERAFADMVKRYGFTPKTPITLEIYQDKTDYGIRTVGLPDLSALGVCFGQVITAMSPSNGDINWGMVMWHELGHVFAIQLSKSRVPRWFTEGLSEYETLIAHPTWRRENDADLYGAVANGTLPSIGALNSEFMQPDQSAVIVAYYQSAVTIEFLVAQYGFGKIVEALKLYGAGKENAEVLKTITGKSIAQLDADFRAYLDIRLAPYKGTFKLPTRGFDNVTKLEINADAHPKDAKLRAHVALGHYYGGDAVKAAAAAKAALDLDAKQPIARYLLAEIALHKSDAATAKAYYESLIADGFDSADLRSRLSQLAEKAGRLDEVEKHMCAAKKLDPERSFPYQELAELYEKKGDTRRALQELEHYAMIEQMELAPLKKLMTAHGKDGNWNKVRLFGEMAIFNNPSDVDILNGLGKAYLETGSPDKALFTFDTMLLVKPEVRRPALVHIGKARALLALGKKPEAKAALQQALKTEPEHPEALELKTKLP